MTETTAQTMSTVMTRVRRAREVIDALAPLRRAIADADEELRAAVLEGAEAGLSERALAAQAETSQPTVRGYLDSRRGAPLPAPDLAEQLWTYHRVASSLSTLVKRTTSQPLAEGAPSSSHIAPATAVREAIKDLDLGANLLAKTASAVEYRQNNPKN